MTDVRLTAINPENSSVVPVACNEKGALKLEEPIAPPEFDGTLDGDLNVSGNSVFAGNIQASTYNVVSDDGAGYQLSSNGAFTCQRTSENGAVFRGYNGRSENVIIKASGSAEFAGGKAGFTADGYLWCTTQRGHTVILESTSNGLGTWADYTPPSRKDLAQEKLEQWSEKDKPDVSDQDSIENGQIRE